MADQPTPPRFYGDTEVGKILDRATELQREIPTRSAGSGGLSLAELEDIAVEAGIDPRHLRRAAMELETGDLGVHGWAKLVGDQLTIVREMVVPGEIPDSGFERVVAVIQQTAHEHGQPSLMGRTLTWQAESPSKMRSILLVVSARDGETLIRLEERLHQFAGGLFGGVIAGVGGGIGVGAGVPLGVALGSVLLTTLIPLGVVGLSYIGCREIYRAVVRSRRTVISELMERVTSEVTACVASALLEDAQEPKQLPGS